MYRLYFVRPFFGIAIFLWIIQDCAVYGFIHTLQHHSSNNGWNLVPKSFLIDHTPTFQSKHYTTSINQITEDKSAQVHVPSSNSSRSNSGSSSILHSRITKIRSNNLAGVVSADHETNQDGDVVLTLDDEFSRLVAITGETGHGKSLLVARVVELLTGGKASMSYVTSSKEMAVVEIELLLREPLLSMTKDAMTNIDLDPSILSDDGSQSGKLILTRRLMYQLSPHDNGNSNKTRMRSECYINGQSVTLKMLSSLSCPLLTLVDTATASVALSKPEARLAILDTAVSADILYRMDSSKKMYRTRRRERERLEEELAARTLPSSFQFTDDDIAGMEMLNHWIEELDIFEKRVEEFCRNVASDSSTGDSAMVAIVEMLATTRWDQSFISGGSASSLLFVLLSDLRDALYSLDNQYSAAMNAVQSLAALSSPKSALTAVENTRKYLFEACQPMTRDESIEQAAEHSHELLNDVESALDNCRRYIEDNEMGLLRSLERSRAVCPMSVESIDELLLEWKSLARKHGIHSSTLPACHRALESERNGNVEARILLPNALAGEKEALFIFEETCKELSEARLEVGRALSNSVSSRFPSLSMGDSVFRVDLKSNERSCSDSIVFSSPLNLGVDSADFILVHGGNNTDGMKEGKVNEIASSGEKARILLAIECELPGSVGAACSCTNTSASVYSTRVTPIAVVYDEIDSHVGGRAAVAMGKMLRDQSQSSQVVAITHSPSVAAAADTHFVVQKILTDSNITGKQTGVRVYSVDESERRKELARMASGDLATEEAEIFADALIREVKRHQNAS